MFKDTSARGVLGLCQLGAAQGDAGAAASRTPRLSSSVGKTWAYVAQGSCSELCIQKLNFAVVIYVPAVPL